MIKHGGAAVGKSSLMPAQPDLVAQQLADLVAYCISWGFRIPHVMTKPSRVELAPYANQIAKLRYKAVRGMHGNPNFEIWSVAHIDDLRTSAERLDDH